jgi:DNA mismatch repair protein MutH
LGELSPPASEAELLTRARSIAGRTIAEVARDLAREVPADLSGHKGWIGHLVERALGVSASSRDAPDFAEIGVELKTIPVDSRGRPRESTFVCALPLDHLPEIDWEQSSVARKLARVLFVPIEVGPALPDRRIGRAVLWSPSPEELVILRGDWDTLIARVIEDGGDAVTAHAGVALQVRPKAARGGVLRPSRDADGAPRLTRPSGLYLRTSFTETILASSA